LLAADIRDKPSMVIPKNFVLKKTGAMNLDFSLTDVKTSIRARK
jgi:hypothetical protein